MSDLLQYKISNLHQLAQCMSNNSRDLKLQVSDFIHDERLSGTRVSVVHSEFGVLFSYIFDAYGTLLTEPTGTYPNIFTYESFLEEIKKFGFLVEYEAENNLGYDQLQFLYRLESLQFDKIRVLSIMDRDLRVFRSGVVVAFKSADNPKWLSNTYVASASEFKQAVVQGTAFNVSEISECQTYDWGWLDFVANINDILDNNQDKFQPDSSWEQV